MADLGISISLDSAQYTRGLAQVQQQTNAATASVSRGLGQIGTTSKQSGAAVSAFTQNLGGLGSILSGGLGTVALAGAAGAAVLKFGEALFEVSKESVEIASKVRGVNSALGFAAGSAEGGAAAYSRFKDTANELGISIEKNQVAYKNFIVSATQSGQSLSAAEKEFKQVAIAMTAMGLSAEDSNGVLLALGQIASKGTVSAEELRGQIGERLPGAFAIAARSIGVTESKLNDMLQKGEVVSKDFLPKFTQELENTFGATAQQNVNSYAATVNKFDNQILGLKVSFGEKLIPVLSRSIELLTKLGEGFGLFSQPSKDIQSISDKLISQKERLIDLVGAITQVNQGEEVRKELISQLNQEYPTFLKGIDSEKVTNEQLFDNLEKVNQAYDKKIKLQVAQESLLAIETQLKDLEKQRFELLQAEAAQLRRNASTRQETGFRSQSQLQFENGLRKQGVEINKSATEFTKDQITQKKLELSYQESLVKEYLKGAKGLNDILGITEEATTKSVSSIDKVKKATKELAESGSLADFENQLKAINETFQNKKLSGGQITDLLGKKEDIEAQIKRLKELYGIVKAETDPATGSLVSLKKQLAEIQTKINESPNDLNLLTTLQTQAVATTASIKDVENQIAKAKRMAETGGVLPTISGISNLPSQGLTDFSIPTLSVPQADTGGLDKLISKLNEVDNKLLGAQRKALDMLASFKETAITGIGESFESLGRGIAIAATGAQSADQVFQQFLKDTLNAVFVSAPRLLGLNLLKEALTTPPPASWAMIAGGVALLGISGLAGGLISQIGQQPESIASQAATGTGLTGATTTQATAQGLGAANNAPQNITQVTVVLETNGIIKEIQKQEYINGEVKGL